MSRNTVREITRFFLAESLPPKAKLILLVVLAYGDSPRCDMSSSFIAEKSGVTAIDVELYLEELVKLGYITKLTIEKRGCESTKYSISLNILNKTNFN